MQGYSVQREKQKQIDIEFVNKTCEMNLSSTQDDEADAACILTAYLKDVGMAAPTKKLGPIGAGESAF